MNLLFKNRKLSIAIMVSVAVHAALLALRFGALEAFKFKPTDPGLEMILVNARHDRAPLKADVFWLRLISMADGGGNAAEGRAKSLLPDLQQSTDGDSAKA